jgi:hypothetical protein
MAKGVPASTAAVTIEMHFLDLRVADLADLATPALEELPFAGGAASRAIFGFSLDIGQFQNDNSHGRLSWKSMAALATTILPKSLLFY